MHYHLEVILPPDAGETEAEVEDAVSEVLAPYSEDRHYSWGEDVGFLASTSSEEAIDRRLEEIIEREHTSRWAFWDYWSVGGRWTGSHDLSHIAPSDLDAFRKAEVAHQFTVSGVQFGRPTLQPASQAEEVDRRWREAFPQSPLKQCPLFDHAGGRDIHRLGYVGEHLTASHLILATHSHVPAEDRAPDASRWSGPLKVERMWLSQVWWAGTWMETAWDGRIPDFEKEFGHYAPEWQEGNMPNEDWWIVTVDYHS